MLDEKIYIRRAIELAQRARDNGNHPFGALLVDELEQILLDAENSVVTRERHHQSCGNKFGQESCRDL